MEQLLEMIVVLQRYAQSVVTGEIKEPNEAVGRELLHAIQSVPLLDKGTFSAFYAQNRKEMEVVHKLAETLQKTVDTVSMLVTK